MKLKNLFYRIPRPVKACFFALLALFMAVVFYIALGCPATFRQEFRRAEKSQLVGPSQIVDTLGSDVCAFEKMLVGETEHGICFFGRYGSRITGDKHRGKRNYLFTYHEKTGPTTAVVAPEYSSLVWDGPGYDLPVYIFTEHTQAIRAELDLRVDFTLTDHTNSQSVVTSLSRNFKGEAILVEAGVLRYIATSEDTQGTYALFQLACLSSDLTASLYDIDITSATAAVRLYDDTGTLIAEETLQIHT